MDADQFAVTIVGVATIAIVVWFFWLKQKEGMRATLTSSGYQEATILVQGGYTPDTVVVESGTPVRLVFRREETSPCSETVVFDDFGKSANLPQGKPVAVELMPTEPGRYRFTCGMGMLQGTLVVE